jgi:hypothetical protein
MRDVQHEFDRLTAENHRLRQIVTNLCKAVRELDARTNTAAGAERIEIGDGK